MSAVMDPIKLVVFDIAGTIIEDHGEVLSSFRLALQQNGVRFAEDELQSWRGASKREVIRNFVERQFDRSSSAEKIGTTYTCFRKSLETLYHENVTAIPGAGSTLSWCRERDIRIAVTTGFYREISDLILAKAGWDQMFDANMSSSDVRLGRPAPFMIFRAMEAAGVSDVRQVINVGDTPLDLQAGTRAGVRGVVGVLTGTHDRQQLQREPHTHIIASVADLPALIEKEF
jgi:phosphoglycolate phosphatase